MHGTQLPYLDDQGGDLPQQIAVTQSDWRWRHAPCVDVGESQDDGYDEEGVGEHQRVADEEQVREEAGEEEAEARERAVARGPIPGEDSSMEIEIKAEIKGNFRKASSERRALRYLQLS